MLTELSVLPCVLLVSLLWSDGEVLLLGIGSEK